MCAWPHGEKYPRVGNSYDRGPWIAGKVLPVGKTQENCSDQDLGRKFVRF